MPPPPEVRDGIAEVGIPEILQEVEAEHAAHADGHIGIAGEVIENLQGEADGPQPGQQGRKGVAAHAKQLRCHLAQGVGQQHFFRQSHQEPLQARVEVVEPLLPGDDLLGHGFIADDGARHQLGKQRHVQRHIQGVPLGRDGPTVHIQHVAHGLEGEKGNADGHDDLGHRQGQAQ